MYIKRGSASSTDIFFFFALVSVLLILIAIQFPMEDIVYVSVVSLSTVVLSLYLIYFGYQLHSGNKIGFWEDCCEHTVNYNIMKTNKIL